MFYQTTITKKGQVTIPKKIRDMLKLTRFNKILIELEKNGEEIRIKPADDFLQVAKKIRVKKKLDPIKSREKMEKFYERL